MKYYSVCLFFLMCRKRSCPSCMKLYGRNFDCVLQDHPCRGVNIHGRLHSWKIVLVCQSMDDWIILNSLNLERRKSGTGRLTGRSNRRYRPERKQRPCSAKGLGYRVGLTTKICGMERIGRALHYCSRACCQEGGRLTHSWNIVVFRQIWNNVRCVQGRLERE